MGMIAGVLAWWLAGCSSPPTGSSDPDPGTDLPEDRVVNDPGGDGRVPLAVPEGTRIAYGYQRYVDPGPALDLRITGPNGSDPVSFRDRLEPLGLDCQAGCLLDRSGSWLAVLVATASGGGDGNTLRLFRVQADGTPVASGIPDVAEAWYPAFGSTRDGPAIYWSRSRPACDADSGLPKGCRAFYRRLLRADAPEEFLFSFPPASILDRTLPHSGFFRLGEDGRTVIVLAPTVGSQRIFLWREAGEPLLQGGPFCGTPDRAPDGSCLESGGAFSDRDPVAVSPDGNHLVAALVLEDRRLVAWHRDLRGDATRAAILMEVPRGSRFSTDACYNRTPPSRWEPTRVVPPLRFSPDSSEVVLVGHAPCGDNRDKPWTKVLGLSLERLDREGRLDPGDLRWITDFPPGDIAASVSVLPEALDLSPSGDLVFLVGTPWLDSRGEPIADSQLQHRNDAEVLVTRRDGTAEVVQWTFGQGWRATSVQVLSPGP
jgi:hypothetical protein